MAQTVIGMFDNAKDAQDAVQQLVQNGFSRDNIDVAARSSSTGSTSGSEYNTGSSSDAGLNTGSTSDASYNTGTTLDSGLNTGTSTDAGYNTGSPTNTGYNTGSLTDSDYGTTRTGSDYNTTNKSDTRDHKESGISRFFKSLFGNDDDEVNRYSNVAERSGSIVTVHAQTSEEAEEAADILDDAGAIDVNEKASKYGYGNYGENTGNTSMSGSLNTPDLTNKEGTTSIPIIEEQLEVGKRTVEKGGVRLKSRIVEREVEENLRLREERVWLERTAVDRPATDADFTNFKEGTMELTEQTEVPVVTKQARVVEEISLGKEVDEKEETVRGTVRNTEVDVENLDKTDNRRETTDTDDWNKTKNSI